MLISSWKSLFWLIFPVVSVFNAADALYWAPIQVDSIVALV